MDDRSEEWAVIRWNCTDRAVSLCLRVHIAIHSPLGGDDRVHASTHPRHGMSIVLFHSSWMLFGLTQRRRRLAHLQPHPGWRPVLASQGDQSFQRRPIEGDLHVYAA